MTVSSRSCPRCHTAVPDGARYCQACGVELTSAASGEFQLYDLERFFSYALDMLCIAGVDGYFKRVNPAFERTLGWTADELLAIPFVELIHPDDREDTIAEVGRLASGAPTLSFENRYRCKDGTYRDLHWASYPEPGTGLVYAVARDVTEWKLRQDRIDPLTAVATRRVFEEAFPAEWSRAARLQSALALAIVDVDGLRDYNRRYGHQAGDRCLKQVARVLAEHARRTGDLVARYGGGEFALILQGGASPDGEAALCDRIRTAVEALAIPNDGSPFGGYLTVSIGAAVAVPPRDSDHHGIVAEAQKALAEAKRQGRNRVVALQATH